MTHPPFNWTSPAGIADGQELCEWCGLILWAVPTGEWRVCRFVDEAHAAELLVTHRDQRPGVDLDEAKQLAQAAAMQIIQ